MERKSSFVFGSVRPNFRGVRQRLSLLGVKLEMMSEIWFVDDELLENWNLVGRKKRKESGVQYNMTNGSCII